MLVLDDVHSYYGDSYVLQGLSLEVAEGEVVGLVGRNGTGKTTTVKSIIGFVVPRGGRIIFKGIDITRRRPYERARRGISIVPQGRMIFSSLSVEENLKFCAVSKPGGWDTTKVYSLFPRLKERARNSGTSLSGGEQQMLCIARALMTNPDLILMDEPSEGLSPLVVQDVERTIRMINGEGVSVLLVEQNLPMTLRLATRLHVMEKGTIMLTAEGANMKSRRGEIESFLDIESVA